MGSVPGKQDPKGGAHKTLEQVIYMAPTQDPNLSNLLKVRSLDSSCPFFQSDNSGVALPHLLDEIFRAIFSQALSFLVKFR